MLLHNAHSGTASFRCENDRLEMTRGVLAVVRVNGKTGKGGELSWAPAWAGTLYYLLSQYSSHNNGCFTRWGHTVGECQGPDSRTCAVSNPMSRLLATQLPTCPGALSATCSRHQEEHNGTKTPPQPSKNLGSSGADWTCSQKHSRTEYKIIPRLTICSVRVCSHSFFFNITFKKRRKKNNSEMLTFLTNTNS